MMRFFLFLAIGGIADLLEAIPQDFGGPLPERIYDATGGSTLEQPLPFESDLNTYDDFSIAAQPQDLISAAYDLSPDNAYLTSLFSNKDDSETSDDSLFSPYLLTSTGTNQPNANVETGYDESTIAYEKFPFYTWPSDQNDAVFPFNCWKENRDGFLCDGNRCRMGRVTLYFFVSSNLPRSIDYFQ